MATAFDPEETHINDPDSGDDADSAPTFLVPATELVAVEHPFIVYNIDKAIDSLGGPKHVSKLVENDEATQPARLSLRPEDPMARTIQAANIRGNGLLLRIDAPKRTGRKRKRGSGEPFQAVQAQQEATNSGQIENAHRKDLLRTLRDNPDDYEVSVVGQIARTHRFRDPPDFVFATPPNSFLARYKEAMFSGSYEKIKNWKLDPDNNKPEFLPPPVVAPSVTPWNYSYRQSVAVKTVSINGETVTFNTTVHARLKIPSIRFDEPTVPDPPADELQASYEGLSEGDKRLVDHVRGHFQRRPVWTRRSIRNYLRGEGFSQRQIEHHIYAHAAYTFSSGPWRDALVRFGKDPRTDPEMRVYQTVSFRTDDMGKVAAQSRAGLGDGQAASADQTITPLPEHSHVFDGTRIDTSGKLWQVCDLTDATVRDLLATSALRDECDTRHSGWYQNGTWGKVRAITKAKMRHLIEAGTPLLGDSEQIKHLLAIPDHITQDNWEQAILGRAPVDDMQRAAMEVIRNEARATLSRDRAVSAALGGPARSSGSAYNSTLNDDGDATSNQYQGGEGQDHEESARVAEMAQALDEASFDESDSGDSDRSDPNEEDDQEEQDGT